jgi:hypothetical protein
MAPYHRQQAVKIEGRHLGEAGATWIERHRSTLPNNHWVAASDRGVVASQPTIGALMDELHKKQIDPEFVAIAFITSDAI